MPDAAERRANLRALRRELPTARRKRPTGHLRVLTVVLTSVALFGAAVFVYRNSTVAPETVALTRGSVEITQSVDGLVVRSEQVYTAPAAGGVRRLVAEGQRVRVGAPIAEIVAAGSTATTTPPTPSTTPPTNTTPTAPPAQGDAAVRRELDRLSASIYDKAAALNRAKANGDAHTADVLQEELDQLAIRQSELTQQLGRSQPVIVTPAPPVQPPSQTPAPSQSPALGQIVAATSGIVIYQSDGLEGQLRPDQAEGWTPATVRTLGGEPRTTPDTVAKGDPVLKVVDNLSVTLLATVPEAALSRLGASATVTVRFVGREGPPVTARITEQIRDGGEVLLVLSAPVFPEELIHQRRFRATLVLGRHEGMLVPRTALDVRDGLQGVWVVEGTSTRFHPVRVVGGTDELLALETDLGAGIRILKTAPTSMR